MGWMPRAYKERKKKSFLFAFSKTGTIWGAAEAVHINRATHYRWMKEDPAYAEDFQAANEELTENLETVAIDKAMRGDNTMLIFLLKSRSPEKYMERFRHEIQSEQLGRLIGLVTSILRRRLSQEVLEQLIPEFDSALNEMQPRKLEVVA